MVNAKQILFLFNLESIDYILSGRTALNYALDTDIFKTKYIEVLFQTILDAESGINIFLENGYNRKGSIFSNGFDRFNVLVCDSEVRFCILPLGAVNLPMLKSLWNTRIYLDKIWCANPIEVIWNKILYTTCDNVEDYNTIYNYFTLYSREFDAFIDKICMLDYETRNDILTTLYIFMSKNNRMSDLILNRYDRIEFLNLHVG